LNFNFASNELTLEIRATVVTQDKSVSKHRLHIGALKHLPAVSEWSDFDDRHVKPLHFALGRLTCSIEHDRAK
jgi:GrpB-like predicted nucleotidyltransferase (UPF0157 family)